MRLTYLGTAAAEAAPALFCRCEHCLYARKVMGREIRTRSGAILDGVIKLDFGPDSYMQELKYGLDYSRVHSLLITHSHEDHFDLSEVLCRREVCAHLPEGEPPMTVYGNAKVGEMLRGRMGDMLAFRRLTTFETVDVEGYQVTPLQAVHCVNRDGGEYPVAYRGKTLFRWEEAFIYLIEKDGQRLLYAHDTDELTEDNIAFLREKRLDLVSLDCTNGYLEVEYVGHMGAQDDLNMRARLMDAGAADENTVFVANHFSHNGLKPFAVMEEMLPGFRVAYDGMTVEV